MGDVRGQFGQFGDKSPNSGWQGDLAALLDVDQLYATIPLRNILHRRNHSHSFIPQNQ